MAEITETPEKGAVGDSEGREREPLEPDFDPKNMRKTKPGVKRLFITLSFLFSFIIGLPFLYKSVEIYRSPLPFRDIESLSTRLESQPLTFPFNFRVFFVGFDFDPARLHREVSEEIDKLTQRRPRCGSMNYTLSVTVDSSSDRFAAVDFDHAEGDDVDELLRAGLEGSGEYSVVVVRGQNEKAVVGKYRHAWMVVREVEPAVEKVAEVLVKVFVNGGREDGSVRSEFMPVGADGRVVFSFSLLNADPRDWSYDWDFEMIDQNVLSPLVNALGAVANISVESQVLYHTPKASFSSWDLKLESHVFHRKDLPFFVNSNEWHLDTSIAAGGRSKILHFVVYVPSAKECPLLLQLSDGEISKTNGFISPMWGGVVVWNPRSCSNEQKDEYNSRHTIPLEDLKRIFEVFMGQLRQLLGLNSIEQYVGKSGIWNLQLSERGFTDWELDVLARQHTCFNLHSCATTLGSLSRLVQSLPRMIIMDEIGKQVKFSLEAAKRAQSNASDGAYDVSAASSRQARSLAEDAFFHPSIMSVSYYSFEHCFAVYSPFFLPVAMHVVLSALREIRRYKREKAKYVSWMMTK